MNRGRIEDKREVKKSMKSLHTIHIAVTDKENLTSKKIINNKKSNMNSIKLTNTKKIQKRVPIEDKDKNVDLKNNINKAKSEKTENDNENTITAQDLTSDNPSEDYWKKLAESRRVALEATLKENVDLHNKVNELEYENSRLRDMVDEAKNLVEVLTEMLEEKESTNEENREEGECSTINESQDNSSSDSEQEDVSFQSCV